jgi:hypothetical protein
MHSEFLWRVLTGRGDCEDVSTYVRIILKLMLKMGRNCVDCVQLAYNRDMWRAHLNMGINLRVPTNTKFFNDTGPISFSRGTLLHGFGKFV